MSAAWRNILIFVVIGLVLSLAIVPRLISNNRSPRRSNLPRAARDATLTVRTEIVRSETLDEKIATVGTVLANEEVEIRSETSGTIDGVFFDEGSRVRKGDVLIKIDDDELQAQLLRATARLALAEQQERRTREMFSQQLVSQEDYDRAASELDVVRAEVKVIEAQIDKTTIRAPFEGVIGLRYVSDGGYVSPSTRIATLQDNRQVKIDFAVPEKYAGRIDEGDRMQFTVPGDSRAFAGTIYAFDSKIDPATRTLRLRALAPNPDGAIYAGAFANVEVSLREKTALMIPAYALIPGLKGHSVFLYRGGGAVSQEVEIGERTSERV
jgi:membrane fusion protein (multidrug efflux system)